MDLARRMITDEEKVWCEENIVKMRDTVPAPGGDPEAYRVAYSKYESVKKRNERAIERHSIQSAQPISDLCTFIFTIFILSGVLKQLKSKPDKA